MSKQVFNCHSLKRRKEIIEQFEIEPIAHLRLLNGQEKKSCTGQPLTDSYYCFNYRPRGKEGGYDVFLCGKQAGKSFLDLLELKEEDYKIFNPLRHLQGEGNDPDADDNDGSDGLPPLGGAPGGDGPRGGTRKKWNPVAKQLYDAIHLLLICWNTVPGKVLLNVKKDLEANRDKEPTSAIKSINTCIVRGGDKTLRQMINELRDQNDIREYDFSLLNDRLAAREIESKFG